MSLSLTARPLLHLASGRLLVSCMHIGVRGKSKYEPYRWQGLQSASKECVGDKGAPLAPSGIRLLQWKTLDISPKHICVAYSDTATQHRGELHEGL
ncbi:hypothetical protein EDD21DRAFT_383384 [Dissophora ornata]|nr:hypothetical protein EDD21DRAFT_383384 [Dissophora ornata]